MKNIYVIEHLSGDKKDIAFVDFSLAEPYLSTLKNGTYNLKTVHLIEDKVDMMGHILHTYDKPQANQESPTME